MGGKVITLFPRTDIPRMLRELADKVEASEEHIESCTVIVDDDMYNYGAANNITAMKNTLWDLEIGRNIFADAITQSRHLINKEDEG